jgi:hypothetical protein
LALEQLGRIAAPSALIAETGQTYLPNGDRHQRHQAALAQQITVYERLLGD